MTIRAKYICDQCNEEVSKQEWMALREHDCPESPENIAKREAECELWQAEHNRLRKLWEDWGEDELKHCRPSLDVGPEQIAAEGFCVLCVQEEDGSYYPTSSVLLNPAWGQVALEFDRAIEYTGDYHHCFLEGLDQIQGVPEGISKHGSFGPDVKFYEFVSGS